MHRPTTHSWSLLAATALALAGEASAQTPPTTEDPGAGSTRYTSGSTPAAGAHGPTARRFMAKLGFPVDPSREAASPRRSYTAVLMYVPEAKPGTYSLGRFVFRGEVSWRWLDHGSLARLAREYLRHLGTNAFYERL
ncbi:MAG: hypothetical protein HY909_10545 [Deltaproteobacteria bacterium]|nr:hypothetical protein [Deltaproteobacteria bacterium]